MSFSVIWHLSTEILIKKRDNWVIEPTLIPQFGDAYISELETGRYSSIEYASFSFYLILFGSNIGELLKIR